MWLTVQERRRLGLQVKIVTCFYFKTIFKIPATLNAVNPSFMNKYIYLYRLLWKIVDHIQICDDT